MIESPKWETISYFGEEAIYFEQAVDMIGCALFENWENHKSDPTYQSKAIEKLFEIVFKGYAQGFLIHHCIPIEKYSAFQLNPLDGTVTYNDIDGPFGMIKEHLEYVLTKNKPFVSKNTLTNKQGRPSDEEAILQEAKERILKKIEMSWAEECQYFLSKYDDHYTTIESIKNIYLRKMYRKWRTARDQGEPLV